MSGDQGREPDGRVLDALFEVIAGRKGADPQSSYTAKLFEAGVEAITAIVSEEAAKIVEAGRLDRPVRLAGDSADPLYHLPVLLAPKAMTPGRAWAVPGRRATTRGCRGK